MANIGDPVRKYEVLPIKHPPVETPDGPSVSPPTTPSEPVPSQPPQKVPA